MNDARHPHPQIDRLRAVFGTDVAAATALCMSPHGLAYHRRAGTFKSVMRRALRAKESGRLSARAYHFVVTGTWTN